MVSMNPLLCSCNRGVMKLLKLNTVGNPDRWFYRCPYPGKHQGYFKWWDEYHGIPWPGASPFVVNDSFTLAETVSGHSDTFAGSCSTPEVSNISNIEHSSGLHSASRIHPQPTGAGHNMGCKQLEYVDMKTALIISFFVMVGTIACLYIGMQIGRYM